MVLWGGLRPIASRVLVDAITLTVWAHAALLVPIQPPDHALRSYLWVLCASVFAIITAGNLTNRWTLTLPMVPFLVLQGLRRILPCHNPKVHKLSWRRYLHGFITLLSVVCIVAAIALCLLFPAVELPTVQGPYHVGKVDFFLPSGHGPADNQQSHAVWVRLLYPTLETPQSLPYLTPSTAIEYCSHIMNMGAPPPLKSLDWILHTWRLTRRSERDGASLAPTEDPLPVVVYSHGLGGHADIYSYQTHTLAAQGNVVLTITHADGSSPVLNLPNGSKREFDYEPQEYAQRHGYNEEVVQMRRNQTEWRVQEVLAATQALIRWNKEDIHADIPHAKDLCLKGRLNIQHLTWMGHSFGGATVLTAAQRHPELVHSVVAHEPAMDWAHPAVLASLFAPPRIANLGHAHLYHENKYSDPSAADNDDIHRSASTLLLFSEEWVNKQFALIPLLREMQQKQRLGSSDTIFDFDFIPGMHHNEFSDTGMLTPTWLARAVGLTGQRSPIDTANDVAKRTLDFLDLSRGRKSS